MLVCTFSDGSPQSIDGHRWGRTVAENVNSHPVVDDVLRHVIVSVPQKPEVVPVVSADVEAVEHLLYVSDHCYLFLAKADQHSNE